jgi:hypothetical protein
MTIEERRSTAIHEAARVVVAWALDLPVGSMQIGCNGDDTAGRSEIDESARQLSLIDRIALCIAGLQAQLLFDASRHISTPALPTSGRSSRCLTVCRKTKLTPSGSKAMTERPSF